MNRLSEDGIKPIELTGRWVGFYRHRWEQLPTCPIVAQIQQTGNSIKGEMYDQITNRSQYLDDFAGVVAQDISSETRIRFAQTLERFGKQVVRTSRLPETHDIQGKITRSRVQFTRTYRGVMEVTWSAQESVVASFRRDPHRVQYSGDFDRDRMCILGSWVIRQSGLLGPFRPPEAWGTFELYRKS
jgi:hypothetical protein